MIDSLILLFFLFKDKKVIKFDLSKNEINPH